MKLTYSFEHIPCPLCNATAGKPVYSWQKSETPYGEAFEITVDLCDQCGLAYMNPRPTPATLKDHYALLSSGATFHETSHNSRHGRLLKERSEFLNSYIGTHEPKFVADIGCGKGELLSRLKLGDAHAIGVDPVATPDPDCKIEFRQMHLEEFVTTSPGSLDLAILVSSLEHFANPLQALKSLNALLLPNGAIYIEVPDTARPEFQLGEYFCFEHLTHFTKRTLGLMLKKAGFEVKSWDDHCSVPNLRCIAVKCEPKEISQEEYASSDHELNEVIRQYGADKEGLLQELRQKIEPQIAKAKANGKGIGIYGAGIHSEFLLEAFELAQCLRCVFDTSPAKHGTRFAGVEVLPPSKIGESQLDSIIISSKHFEEEIAGTIAKFNHNNINVVRLYE